MRSFGCMDRAFSKLIRNLDFFIPLVIVQILVFLLMWLSPVRHWIITATLQVMSNTDVNPLMQSSYMYLQLLNIVAALVWFGSFAYILYRMRDVLEIRNKPVNYWIFTVVFFISLIVIDLCLFLVMMITLFVIISLVFVFALLGKLLGLAAIALIGGVLSILGLIVLFALSVSAVAIVMLWLGAYIAQHDTFAAFKFAWHEFWRRPFSNGGFALFTMALVLMILFALYVPFIVYFVHVGNIQVGLTLLYTIHWPLFAIYSFVMALLVSFLYAWITLGFAMRSVLLNDPRRLGRKRAP